MPAQRFTVTGLVGRVEALTLWAEDMDEAQRIYQSVQQARGASVVRVRSVEEAPPDA